MLSIKTVCNTKVEMMLPKNDSTNCQLPVNCKLNGLIISIDVSFLEHFDANNNNPISQDTVDELEEYYPFLNICERSIGADMCFNLLFIRDNNTYQCFSNISSRSTQIDIDSIVWKYETCHDSRWKDSAYDSINDHVDKIKTTICNILSDFGGCDILPKHIVPNYNHIKNIERCSIENNIAFENSQYAILNVLNNQKLETHRPLEIKAMSKKEYINMMFDEVYDLAVSDYRELKMGKLIYGNFGKAIVSSEVFKDTNGTVWIQLKDVHDDTRKYMLSLAGYGINYTGTHNLIFTDSKSYVKYRNIDLIVDDKTDPHHGWGPEWVAPKQGKRTPLPKEVINALPIKEWSPVTNNLI